MSTPSMVTVMAGTAVVRSESLVACRNPDLPNQPPIDHTPKPRWGKDECRRERCMGEGAEDGAVGFGLSEREGPSWERLGRRPLFLAGPASGMWRAFRLQPLYVLPSTPCLEGSGEGRVTP